MIRVTLNINKRKRMKGSIPCDEKMDKKYDRLKQSVIPLNTTITIRH